MMTFENSIGKVDRRQGKSAFVEIPLKDFGKTMLRLEAKKITRISGITGYDNGKEIEMVYHFTYDGKILSIKTRLPRKEPVMQSITEKFPGAEIYERECFEMLGIKFRGNKNLNRILLGQESPVNPLLKGGKK